MNCPKCKNPIEDNATVCEWCGGIIIKINQTINSDVGISSDPDTLIKAYEAVINYWIVCIDNHISGKSDISDFDDFLEPLKTLSNKIDELESIMTETQKKKIKYLSDISNNATDRLNAHSQSILKKQNKGGCMSVIILFILFFASIAGIFQII